MSTKPIAISKKISAAKPATTKPAAATKAPIVKNAIKPAPKATMAKTTSANPAAPKPALIKAKLAPTAPKKSEKEKTPKLKMERDSFTMPKAEYAQFYVLKERLVKAGKPAKKSELLRAGLMLLSALNDAELKATMEKVPAIKTGRPKK